MANATSDPRTLPELLAGLPGEIANLFRKEIQLARAETSEKVTEATTALSGIVVGVALAIGALIVLLQALVIALANVGIEPGWAALIVGVVVALIAYLMIHKGLSNLKATSLTPERTLESLKNDGRTLKEQMP